MYSRISETLFSATSQFSASQSSTDPYVLSSRSCEPSSSNIFKFLSSKQKNNFRSSSSFQDLSKYRQINLEQSDLSPETVRSVTHAKPSYPLQRENGPLSFSKDKTLPGTPFFQKKWVPAITCLIFMLLSFIYLFLSWSQGTAIFYAVLDCGSTGTRIYIYKAFVYHNKGSLPIILKSFPEDLGKNSSLQIGRAYNRMETEPGLDKLVHNVSGLKMAIQPLLRWSENQIPKHAHKSTSLFLCATAGVRKLPSADSEWLLNNTWLILKASSFLCKRNWVKTISGVEEAYYGWIALNYHKNVLGTVPKKDTFGALDLGGSSLQVTFETNAHLPNETSLSLNIGSVNHHLSAYSLSGYGLNDAFDKSVVHLLKSHSEIAKANLSNGNLELAHPCLQSGYKEKYTCSQCASIYGEVGSPSIGEINFKKGIKPGISLSLIGAPKWKECSSLAKIAVNFSEWSGGNKGIDCDLEPCALTENLPHPYGEFYAMSGFFVVYRFFNLTSESTLKDVLDKGHEFCEKSWKVAKVSVPPQPFIEQYCFRALYVVSLLREGLHITDGQVTIDSGSITWTIGVVILQARDAFPNMMRYYKYTIFQMKNPIILFTILLISLFLLVCALLYGDWVPRLFRRQYLPLFGTSSTSTSVLGFKSWSLINSGVQMSLSPMVGSNIQLSDASLYPSTNAVSHSYSSGSLGQMHFDNNSIGSIWSPHGGQMRLQSRRSQSHEDLNSLLAESRIVKL